MSSSETYANDVRSWIAEAAETRIGRRKRVLAEIAREVGIHVRRVAAHFYGEVRSPSAAEYEQFKRWREDELRLMARERIQLAVRLEWIEARLAAREAGQNAMAGKEVGVLVHRVSEGVVACRRVAGGEGMIEDVRQGSLLG